MKLQPFVTLIGKSKEAVDEAMAPIRARMVKSKAEVKKVELDDQILQKETKIQEMCLDKDIDLVNQGKYQSPTFRSSRDPHYINYRNLFVSLPFMPEFLVTWILDKDKVHWFRLIPESIIWVMKAISNLSMGNTPLIIAHLKFFPRKLIERLGGYRGKFD